MKAADLRKQNEKELAQNVRDMKVAAWKGRINNRAGLLTNTASIGATRKDVARGLTVLSEKARAAKSAAQAKPAKTAKQASQSQGAKA